MKSGTATEVLLQDAAKALRRRVLGASEKSISDRAFLAWLLRDDAPLDDLVTLSKSVTAKLTAGRSYHDIAVLGYTSSVIGLEDDQSEGLSSALQWLCGRSPEIAGDPAPFYTDAVALLGIALGAKALAGEYPETVRKWLEGFVPKASELAAVENWQRCLFAAALHLVGSTCVALLDDQDVADVRTALRARDACPTSLRKEDRQEDERQTLELMKTGGQDSISTARAALRLAAFLWARRSAPIFVPGRAEVSDVVKLLARVPAGLRRWVWEQKPRVRGGEPRKWHIDHEYHVQDLLYFLLAPNFPDIKDEEYFPSLGQKQPRTDIYIPSLKLILEAKFVRQADPFQKVIDEIAADAGTYLTDGSEYSGIVAFVWDASRRTEQHALLRSGLLKIPGVVGAVVVPRPGAIND